MKNFFNLLLMSSRGLAVGFAVAWPNATQWDLIANDQRFQSIGLFLSGGLLLSLFSVAISKRVWPLGDAARALGFLLGAALCFSLVRQQATLLVWNSLWGVSGTFFGAALGKILLSRVKVKVTAAKSEREEVLCSP